MDKSTKSPVITLILCIMFGIFGFHRFYAGRIFSGLLMILTFGGLTIWWMIDFTTIILGNFTDSSEKKISFEYHSQENVLEPAGFWLRVCARIIDISIIYTVDLALCIIIVLYTSDFDAVFGININDMMSGVATQSQFSYINLLYFVIAFFYYTIYTATKSGATPGKKLVWIYVVNEDGQTLSPERSALRTLCYPFSYIIFGIGLLMVAFTGNKRALHDYMAKTYVARGRVK